MTRELWYFGAHVVKGDYYLWGEKKTSVKFGSCFLRQAEIRLLLPGPRLGGITYFGAFSKETPRPEIRFLSGVRQLHLIPRPSKPFA